MTLFQKRLVRIILLLIITTLLYVLMFNDEFMKLLLPQVQVGLLGIVKGVLGATVGTVIGMILFPHKVEWGDSLLEIGAGAYARLIISLAFMYIMFEYA